MSGIAVFNSAVSQLQNQQQNLLKIRQARQRMEADEEERAFQRKKREMDLESARRSGKLTDLQIDAFNAQTKAYDQQQDDIAKGWNGQIKLAEHQAKTTADEAMNWAKMAYKSDPQGVTSFLQATQRNQNRQQMIVPKMSYGRIGYDVEDVEQPEAPTRKDIASQAAQIARQRGTGMTADYMAEAESLLSGRSGEPAMKPVTGSIPERPIRGKDEWKPVEGLKDAEGNPVPAWKQIKMRREQGNTWADKSNDKVKMRLPNGQSVYIPKANVEAATKRGAVVI